MASALRLLQTNSGQYPTLPAAEPPDPLAVNSNVVVILAALLCALICVIGLAAITRYTRNRGVAAPSSAASKGLKKKALRALPKLAYEDAVEEVETVLTECAICLSEFEAKEEVRVLPPCGHGFHVACVDTWLRAHSSCPSCRCVLDVDAPPKLPPETAARCGKCEASSSSSGASGDGAAGFLA
ncbi:hypothetical protein PR202_gb18454 [Eleusine coracana subsp. coracana]|uniref:RING-type E3 ubiquitin transferase n=1 Tax=Eleusine coracana subsp. coracana TaxID=191504 RepID=A0AAV5F5M9_ELECO|nr:hypothetical protein QOZ80_3BG0295730 [Eleusine coracana subsp. coracana]GJN30168.1 hypothetical protein PR202_gb18454 [Eleusine coracana subsp. coracana]